MKKKYLIPSLVAAGLLPAQNAFAFPFELGTSAAHPDSSLAISRAFHLFHKYTLAGHSSHSSHASHSSHRSSTGGGLFLLPRATPPVYQPPVYVPPPVPLVTLPGNSNKFAEIVRQVQTALIAYGYYSGRIDGVVGVDTRVSIGRLQHDYGLTVTGTVTPELLNALRIVAQ
jgi:Putative peptidoglycan binding domain